MWMLNVLLIEDKDHIYRQSGNMATTVLEESHLHWTFMGVVVVVVQGCARDLRAANMQITTTSSLFSVPTYPQFPFSSSFFQCL